MKNPRALLLACFALGSQSAPAAPAAPAAPQAIVQEITAKEFKDIPGKEGLVLLVEYPPGAVDAIHRHDAHAFVYVLEGEIEMQVRGGKRVKLGPGQVYYEGPEDVHIVGRNANSAKRAKFVAFLVKNTGAAPFIPTE